jgi:hypothetical protein
VKKLAAFVSQFGLQPDIECRFPHPLQSVGCWLQSEGMAWARGVPEDIRLYGIWLIGMIEAMSRRMVETETEWSVVSVDNGKSIVFVTLQESSRRACTLETIGFDKKKSD